MNGPLPWHDEQWARLIPLRARRRMPHALLLSGPAGVGKRCFSRRLANALLCRSASPEGACGKCRSCHLAALDHHPDQHLVGLPENKRVIGIDQIRELIERTTLRASSASCKVAVVAPAERMTRAAANTLLKTLEEPPGDTVFVLVSSQSSRLPATIRSRCQTLSFPSPPARAARSWIEKQLPERMPVALLLELAHGAPFVALDLAERNALEGRAVLLDELASLIDGSGALASTAERWGEQGIDEVSWWLTGIVQEAIRARAAPRFRRAADGVDALAGQMDLKAWFHLLDACLSARDALAGQLNLNERLLLESLALACRRAPHHDAPAPRD